MVSLVLPLALLAATAQVQPPPPVPSRSPVTRDTPQPALQGTAVIRGRVVEQDTGQPVPRVLVMLMSAALRRPQGESRVQAETDADGHYEFTSLPAGEYMLSARPGDLRATHLPQAFGGTAPSDWGRLQRPRPIELADGEVFEDANLALRRALAIEGRVFNDYGEPMAGLSVQVRAAGTGQPVGFAGSFSFSSDDRGAYRIYGLPPGSYIVCAVPRSMGPAPPGADTRYVETCHPTALTEADAQSVIVSTGDVSGVDIRLQRSRTYTVSGMAIDSAGAPLLRAQVSLTRFDRSGTTGSGVQVDADGRFVVRGLAPGEYGIRADTWRPRGPGEAPDAEREVAFVSFRIDGFDIDGLLVATRKAATVTGRVVFDDAAPPDGIGAMQVTARPDLVAMRRGIMTSSPSARVDADMTFRLSGLFGPLAISLSGAPRGWIVKSVRYQARDITDTSVDFAGAREADRVEIVLTNRPARLAGTVLDEDGAPAPFTEIMLLPADSARWSFDAGLRRTMAAQSSAAFRFPPLRAGEYLIAAIDPDDGPRGMPDDKYLARVAAVADRLTLVESEEQVLHLRVRRLR